MALEYDDALKIERGSRRFRTGVLRLKMLRPEDPVRGAVLKLQQLHVDDIAGRGYWVDVPTVDADASDEIQVA